MHSNESPPSARLMQYIVGVWISKPIYVAAELGLADLLADGPLGIEELARRTKTHTPFLYRMMRGLASVGIFRETEPEVFELTPMAELLQSGAMRSIALLFNSDWSDRAWGRFLESVRTGETAFALAHGVPVAQWLEANPQAAAVFNEANAVKAAGSLRAIVEGYDFSGIRALTDVGGGLGILLAEILQANPDLSGVVAEIPSVVPLAEKTLAARGLTDRGRAMECDFFTSVPAGSDAYLLSNILHDWPDEKCRIILENCRRAMAEGSRLLIVEMLIRPGNDPSVAKLLDLEMLVTTGGRERTEDEFRTLLEGAGYELSRIIPLEGEVHVIEAKPASL